MKSTLYHTSTLEQRTLSTFTTREDRDYFTHSISWLLMTWLYPGSSSHDIDLISTVHSQYTVISYKVLLNEIAKVLKIASDNPGIWISTAFPFQLFVWWHQAITWTNVHFSSVRFCGIHLGAISQGFPKLLSCMMSLEMSLLKIPSHPLVSNQLTNADQDLQCYRPGGLRRNISVLRSIPCLLMHWLLKSPEHQQT